MISIFVFLPDRQALLRGLSVVHATLLLSFLLVLALATGRARAEEIVCAGNNLMPVFAAEHPEAIATIEKEEAAVPNGKGLLWRIAKDGVEPSWLLGTMHVSDPRVTEMPESARDAFDAAGTVVVEVKELGEAPEKLAAALFANPEYSSLSGDQTLKDLLDEEEEAVLKAALDRHGVPYVAVSRMKPWLIMSMLTSRDCEVRRMQAGEKLLDMKLASEAAESGKDLKGLETIEEQFSAMNSMPMDAQVDMLVATASLDDEIADLYETMTALYLEHRIAAIMPMLKEASRIYGFEDDATQTALFEDSLIETRNRTMAKRAGPILEEGNAFIAVGALHLPGEEGLVALLRDAGYTVTPVE